MCAWYLVVFFFRWHDIKYERDQQEAVICICFFLFTNATLQAIKARDSDLKRSHTLSLMLAVCPVLMRNLKYLVVR